MNHHTRNFDARTLARLKYISTLELYDSEMDYKKKTWQQKLESSKNFPKTLRLESSFPCYRALKKMGAELGDSVVLAPPLEVDAIMKNIPRGELITLKEICKRLARKHGTQYCCTLTTGIFVTTAANAAEETKGDTPYWRTLKSNGELNMKYPGGVERQKRLLEAEGHTIIQRGKRLFVEDFEKKLAET